MRSYSERLARGRFGIGCRAFFEMETVRATGFAFGLDATIGRETTTVVVPGRTATVTPEPSSPAPSSAKPCSTLRMYRPLVRPVKSRAE